jgi:hypothetical protein
MSRCALLVGCPGGTIEAAPRLAGVGRDLDVMSTALRSRGFEIRQLSETEATRAGVLAAYRELIGDLTADDAAVFYFSGHGGMAEQSPPGLDPKAPEQYQYLLTSDIAESAVGDFRGVTALELAALQNELTEVTPNVTTILDTCFGGRMSREGETPRGAARVSYVDVAAHLAGLSPAIVDLARKAPEGNLSAVRLVASGRLGPAREVNLAEGVVGLFTSVLTRTLEESKDLRLSWSMLMEGIRSGVNVIRREQRPDAEGPTDRLPFSLETVPDAALRVLIGSVAGTIRGTLAGGRIAGVNIGDVYAVMTAGATAADLGTALAVVIVDQVGLVEATGPLTFQAGHDRLPPDALAYPLEKALGRSPVVVTGSGARAEAVRSAVATASHVRLADTGDPADSAAATAFVDVDNELLTLRDGQGTLIGPAVAPDLGATVENLNRLARAQGFRLLPETPPAIVRDPYQVGIGFAVGGERRPVISDARPISAFTGQRLYLTLRNSGRNLLFFHIFDVSVSGRIRLVTSASPSGVLVIPGREHVIGRIENGQLIGQQLSWDDGISTAGPRTLTLVVLVTLEQQNLRAVEQEGVSGGQRNPRATALQQWLDHLGRAVTRGGRRAGAPRAKDRYGVRQIDLLMFPTPPPRDESTTFIRDQRPDVSLRLSAPPTGGGSGHLVVRLNDLGLLGARSTDQRPTRLDALVLTGPDPAADGAPRWLATTHRLPSHADVVIFDAAARDYLEIAVWASFDPAAADDLDGLLAGASVPARSGPAPAADAGAGLQARVAALSAVTDIVETAAALLADAVEEPLGLYRSWSRPVGEPSVAPTSGSETVVAQDVTFGVEVRRPGP